VGGRSLPALSVTGPWAAPAATIYQACQALLSQQVIPARCCLFRSAHIMELAGWSNTRQAGTCQTGCFKLHIQDTSIAAGPTAAASDCVSGSTRSDRACRAYSSGLHVHSQQGVCQKLHVTGTRERCSLLSRFAPMGRWAKSHMQRDAHVKCVARHVGPQQTHILFKVPQQTLNKLFKGFQQTHNLFKEGCRVLEAPSSALQRPL
jgi:hypothetical protein